MTDVKSPNTGYIIRYTGTDLDDENWEANEITLADSGLTQTEYDNLPNYDDASQPWEPAVQTIPTEQYGTTAQRPTLGAHEFYTRYNTTYGKLEIHDSSGWHDVDGNPLA